MKKKRNSPVHYPYDWTEDLEGGEKRKLKKIQKNEKIPKRNKTHLPHPVWPNWRCLKPN